MRERLFAARLHSRKECHRMWGERVDVLLMCCQRRAHEDYFNFSIFQLPKLYNSSLNSQMATSRSSRTTKPPHGAVAYAPYIDERGRQYDPGAETSDSEEEDDTYVPPSPKRRKMDTRAHFSVAKLSKASAPSALKECWTMRQLPFATTVARTCTLNVSNASWP